MQQALNLILGLAVGLFNLIVAAIAAIEGFCRHVLTGVGITGELQTVLLVILAVLLIVAAFRVFGRLFAVLIALVLLLMLLHALVAGGHPAGLHV
ncbi:hypothetical protein [Lichenicola sp.]|uniref:hypothetical protein n=1 Tax=Lichenicola sp. TaxID=2804529 RepID=UPI003B005563